MKYCGWNSGAVSWKSGSWATDSDRTPVARADEEVGTGARTRPGSDHLLPQVPAPAAPAVRCIACGELGEVVELDELTGREDDDAVQGIERRQRREQLTRRTAGHR